MTEQLDQRVRLAAFQWLRVQSDLLGEVLPRSLLAEGFTFDGVRVPLLGPQGIFKPGLMTEPPLSITTIPGQYPDAMGGSLLASCIMRRSIGNSSPSDRITRSRSGSRSWTKRTDRCCFTA